jgi:hypothetical protein
MERADQVHVRNPCHVVSTAPDGGRVDRTPGTVVVAAVDCPQIFAVVVVPRKGAMHKRNNGFFYTNVVFRQLGNWLVSAIERW